MKRALLVLTSMALTLAPTVASAAAPGLRPYGQIGMRSAALPQDDSNDDGGTGTAAAFDGGSFAVAGLAVIAIALGVYVAIDNNDDDAPVSS